MQIGMREIGIHKIGTVELRVRVPAGQVAAVHLRHMHDGEAAFALSLASAGAVSFTAL